jgi:hypothetical protein
MIAALPRAGHTRLDAMVVEVDDDDEPGVVTIGEVDDVEVGIVDNVVVVGEPDVGELEPTRRPTTSAPSARGIKMKRPNFDGSDAFTSLIYIVSCFAPDTLDVRTTLCCSRSYLDVRCNNSRNAKAINSELIAPMAEELITQC